MARRMILLSVVLLLLLGGATALFRVFFPDQAAVVATPVDASVPVVRLEPVVTPPAAVDSPDASTPTPAPPSLRVVDSAGVLEKRDEAGWSALGTGDTLVASDALRTARNASAVIQVGQAGRVRMGARTEVQFRQVDKDVVRVRLKEGRVVAEAEQSGGALFQVETEGSDAVAETRDGRFSVMSDGRGLVAVATETGKVRLRAAGREVAVPPGQQSVVQGGAPAAPAPIPTSLLLKVAAPAKKLTKEKEHLVEGTASPGSLVQVKGRTARVDGQGNFRIKVPLQEGANTVEVVAQDVMGREKNQRYSITVDSRAPAIKGRMNWGETAEQ